MKKKIVAVICAVALCLALPSMAFGLSSSEAKNISTGGGATASVTTIGKTDLSKLATASASAPAGATINGDNLGTLEITYSGDNFEGITLTVNLGTAYAGQTCTVYVVHADKSTETLTCPVASNGTITMTITKLSTYTFSCVKASGSSSANTSSTSPATGLSLTGVACGVVACVAVGGCAVLALRKKEEK